jgi:copper(I)-binding protein
VRKFILLLALFANSAFADMAPHIINPFVTATPPGATVAAGYLKIMNMSDKPLEITGAQSSTIDRVEIHLSSVVDDVAKMEKVDSLVIPAGETVELKHGSYHIMLMELTAPLKPGDNVDVTLNTSRGDIALQMPVVKHAMGGSHDMKHGDMKHGDKKHDSHSSDKKMKH